MSEHPNVETVNRMTEAIFGPGPRHPREDLHRRLRVPSPWARTPRRGSPGVGGCSETVGCVFEATNGQIELEQQFCIGADGWAAEWEHATLGRNGTDSRVATTPSCTDSTVTGSPRCGCSSARSRTRPRRSSADPPASRQEWSRMEPDRGRARGMRPPVGRRLPPALRRSSSRHSTSTTSTASRPRRTSPVTTKRRFAALGTRPPASASTTARSTGRRTSGCDSGRGSGSRATSARCRGWVDRTARLLDEATSTASSRATSSTGWR